MLVLLWFACAVNIENPSRDCTSTGDGGRFCYHYPESTDVYLPNCDLTDQQELWRVFAQS